MTRTSLRIALFATLVAVLALVPSALAGKPSGGGGLALALMDGATEPVNGGRITFDVSTTATARPFVGVRCWQGATWVYDGYVGFFPDYMFDPWLTLGSTYWIAGVEASCTARLFYYDRRGNQKVLATMSFLVAR